MHNIDIVNNPPILMHWRNIAPRSFLHAAAVCAPPTRALKIIPHGHADYCELMLCVFGSGEHQWNGATQPIRRGDLCFLGTGDRHSITATAGNGLHWINVAFPADAWRDFRRFAEPDERGEPPLIRQRHMDPHTANSGARLFSETLSMFAQNGVASRMQLAQFLSQAMPLLSNDGHRPAMGDYRDAIPSDAPLWLQSAFASLLRGTGEKGLRGGVPALRESAGVTSTHLARTVRSLTGQTPTDLINGIRLRHAAWLLSVTETPIADIAWECGYNEIPYFYRLFKALYGETPRGYRRRRAAGAVAPET